MMAKRGVLAYMAGDTSDVFPAIDAHVHLWDPARAPLAVDDAPNTRPIDRAFTRGSRTRSCAAPASTQSVLVQSACLDADTDLMFEHAEARARSSRWSPGSRSTTRRERPTGSPSWRSGRSCAACAISSTTRPTRTGSCARPVLEGIALLEERGLILELPAVFPRHLGDVPELARSFPDLTIVIDHLGKPPLGSDAMPRWARALAAAAATRTCRPSSRA